MHSLRSILSAVRQGDFMQSVDLREAYLHVPVHPSHRRFLRFEYAGTHFQYCAMPFGLSSAPRTFTKLVAAVAATLRPVPVRLLCYLDDILVLSASRTQAAHDMDMVLSTFRAHGFTINLDKSHLEPGTCILHLGSLIDSAKGQVFLSPERVQNIQLLIDQVLAQRSVPLLVLSQLLGKLVSCFHIVPWARRHARPLQWLLLPFQRGGSANSSRKVVVPPQVRLSLRWWRSAALRRGCHFLDLERIVLTTDASLQGWGAHLGNQIAQGLWSPSERLQSINLLELRAIHLALLHFSTAVQGRHVLVLTDNTSAKAHVNREGGTRSRLLMLESERLFRWAERHLLSIRADHISGTANVQADWLSREQIEPSEWQLHPRLFRELSLRFGTPSVDLFASPANAQLPRFISRYPSPLAEDTDALRCRWPMGLLYAFPPVTLIQQVVRKIVAEGAEVLLVAPNWPRRPWFADLVELSMSSPWVKSASSDFPVPRGRSSSRASVAPVGRVAFERLILKKDRLSDKVIGTIQASRRPSTTRIYEASWKAFCGWCAGQHVDPTSAAIQDVLDFLQSGLDRGLAPATLRRQVAALSTVLSCSPYPSLAHHPWVRGFLHGATNLRPPTVHRYPSWDLGLVLQALTRPPFEPLGSVSLRFLSFKVAFLLAITSARRISELAALSVRQDLCIFHTNTVVLRLDPAFTPKVNSWFHRSQEIVLPDFCPSPRHHQEVLWHTLDVRRALRRYIRRTASFRKTEALLVSFHPASMGQKVSSATVGRWIKACISSAYERQARPPPARILPHSTRSAATSAAWATQASVLDICRAATWTSLSPFIRHYRIDAYASAEASFGRRVLQRVVSDSSTGSSQLPALGV